MSNAMELEVRCCSNEQMECLDNGNSNVTERTFDSSKSWCEQHNGHICNISELNAGICCNGHNAQVWVQDICEMQDMYCSSEASGLGQVMEEMVIGEYTNDMRITGISVYVYLKNNGNGKKTIRLSKGDKTIVLAQKYSDEWNEDYAIAFEDNTTTTTTERYLQNVSESEQLIYTPLEPLAVFENTPVSGRYRLSVSSTQASEELHLYQWCIAIQSQQLLTMITTFFIDMSSPSSSSSSSSSFDSFEDVDDMDRKKDCKPFSSVVYNNNNNTILNISIAPVQSLEKIMCGQWFANGAMEACVNFIQNIKSTTTYYHICQFVIVTTTTTTTMTMTVNDNPNNQICAQWNPNDMYANISAMANGQWSQLPGQIIYTSPSYMQMAQFCPTSICRPNAARVCIDYEFNTNVQTHLQTVSLSILGIDWRIQTARVFWTLWNAGDGVVQITMSDCSFSVIGKGQNLFRFLNDNSSSSSSSPVVSIMLTQMTVTSSTSPENGQSNLINQTLFYVSHAYQVWMQNWSVRKNVAGHILYGANVQTFVLRNAFVEFVSDYDYKANNNNDNDDDVVDAAFELAQVTLFDVHNSTFIATTPLSPSALPYSTLFVIASTQRQDLSFNVSHSIFQAFAKHVFDISLVKGSSLQYATLQHVLFDNIHGLNNIQIYIYIY
ncbi:hypothetical protein RFI_14296, partial [Reticulomyxa filosa]